MRKFTLKTAGLLAAALLLAFIIMNDGLPPNSGGYHYTDRVAVLEYHHIDPEASSYTVTPRQFEQQLEALKDNHYNVITMKEFLAFLAGQPVPPDAVLLTFDDGYESFYTYGYPILKKLGMTASNFLIVSYVGTNPGIPFLSWDQIGQMSRDGFGFYSHTYDSHDFAEDAKGKPVNSLTNRIYLKDQKRMETADEYKLRVQTDLQKAEAGIESHLGAQARLLCFPHGRFNETVLNLGREAGVTAFFTGVDGLNAPGTTLVKRINAGAGNVSADKLLSKLKMETTVTGSLFIAAKNTVNAYRQGE